MGRWRQGLAAAAMAGSEGRGAKYVVRFSRRSCARPPAHAGMVSQGGTPLWRQFGMGHMPCLTLVRRVPWSVPCSSARARSKQHAACWPAALCVHFRLHMAALQEQNQPWTNLR